MHPRLVLTMLITGALLTGCTQLQYASGYSAPADQADSIYRQGLRYTQGAGEEQNYQKGLSKFQQAARAGSSEAAYMAGIAYLTGRGTVKDLGAAAYWLELAAKKNHPGALYQLGLLHLNGSGTEKNPKLATLYIGLAAEQLHQRAMRDLGACYSAGIGLPKRDDYAWYWFNQASLTSSPAEQSKLLLARERISKQVSVERQERATFVIEKSLSENSSIARAIFVQQTLKAIGYKIREIDGIWGAESRSALKQYLLERELKQINPSPTAEVVDLIKTDQKI